MQPSRLPPQSPHPTRTSPVRHGKRFGSLTVPEEHREAAIKGEATGWGKMILFEMDKYIDCTFSTNFLFCVQVAC